MWKTVNYIYSALYKDKSIGRNCSESSNIKTTVHYRRYIINGSLFDLQWFQCVFNNNNNSENQNDKKDKQDNYGYCKARILTSTDADPSFHLQLAMHSVCDCLHNNNSKKTSNDI